MNEKRRNNRKRIFRNGENPCKAKKFISNTLTSKESHDLFSVGSRKNYCGTSGKNGRHYSLKGAVPASTVGRTGNMHGISATP